MPDNSFDVVSIVDMPEVLNAVQQATKEILNRFDLKNSKSAIELNEKDSKLVVTALKAGVAKTHVIDGRIPHALLLEIYTEAGIGTEIVL